MSLAFGANGLRPTMSRVAVGLPCPDLTAMKALSLFRPQSMTPAGMYLLPRRVSLAVSA
jgi:hypothetical protein